MKDVETAPAVSAFSFPLSGGGQDAIGRDRSSIYG